MFVFQAGPSSKQMPTPGSASLAPGSGGWVAEQKTLIGNARQQLLTIKEVIGDTELSAVLRASMAQAPMEELAGSLSKLSANLRRYPALAGEAGKLEELKGKFSAQAKAEELDVEKALKTIEGVAGKLEKPQVQAKKPKEAKTAREIMSTKPDRAVPIESLGLLAYGASHIYLVDKEGNVTAPAGSDCYSSKQMTKEQLNDILTNLLVYSQKEDVGWIKKLPLSKIRKSDLSEDEYTLLKLLFRTAIMMGEPRGKELFDKAREDPVRKHLFANILENIRGMDVKSAILSFYDPTAEGGRGHSFVATLLKEYGVSERSQKFWATRYKAVAEPALKDILSAQGTAWHEKKAAPELTALPTGPIIPLRPKEKMDTPLKLPVHDSGKKREEPAGKAPEKKEEPLPKPAEVDLGWKESSQIVSFNEAKALPKAVSKKGGRGARKAQTTTDLSFRQQDSESPVDQAYNETMRKGMGRIRERAEIKMKQGKIAQREAQERKALAQKEAKKADDEKEPEKGKRIEPKAPSADEEGSGLSKLEIAVEKRAVKAAKPKEEPNTWAEREGKTETIFSKYPEFNGKELKCNVGWIAEKMSDKTFMAAYEELSEDPQVRKRALQEFLDYVNSHKGHYASERTVEGLKAELQDFMK